MCIITGHIRDGHTVVAVNTVVAERKERLGYDMSQIRRSLKDLHFQVSAKFEDSLLDLMRLSAVSDRLLTTENIVLMIEEQVRYAKTTDRLLRHETDLKNLGSGWKMETLWHGANFTGYAEGNVVSSASPTPSSSGTHESDDDNSSLSSGSSSTASTIMQSYIVGLDEPSSSVRQVLDNITRECPAKPNDQTVERVTNGMRRTVLGSPSCRVHVGDGRHGKLAWEDDHLLLYAPKTSTNTVVEPQVLIQVSYTG